MKKKAVKVFGPGKSYKATRTVREEPYKTMTFRISSDLKKKLEKYAKGEQAHLSEVLRTMITKTIKGA